MHTNKMLLGLLASVVLPLTNVACGGATDPVASDSANTTHAPAPSASSQDDAGSSSTNDGGSNGNGNGGTADAGTTSTTTSDAGTGSTIDAGTGPTFAANCRVAVAQQELCVEDVSGHPGDVVGIPIDLLGTAACTDALEAYANLLVSDYFALANPIQQVDCISRDVQPSSQPDTNEILWDAFGGGAIAACPEHIQNGRLDVIQVQILPGTPAGDYDVVLGGNSVAPSDPACGTLGYGINGHIHVD